MGIAQCPNSGRDLEFRITHKATDYRARTGKIKTPHGDFETPVFMPVGTQGSVKAVSPEDLEEAGRHGAPSLLSPLTGLPATLVVGSEVEMQRLADSEALTLFDIGALGAVVVDDEGVAGILPIEAVDEYLGSGAYKPAPEVMGPTAKGGDTGLGGKHQTPEGFVICVATVDDALCGHVNKVAFLDKNHLPICQNPNLQSHTLQITSK